MQWRHKRVPPLTLEILHNAYTCLWLFADRDVERYLKILRWSSCAFWKDNCINRIAKRAARRRRYFDFAFYPATIITHRCSPRMHAQTQRQNIFDYRNCARCICTAPISSETLNYRKVNLSGGLAIGEFSSSIIKLFPLGGHGRREGIGAEGRHGETGRGAGQEMHSRRNKTCRI